MILDVIVIVLFVLMMIYGYKKGCISIVAKLISVIVALVLAYFLANTVGGYIETTEIGIKITTSIEKVVADEFSKSQESTIIAALQDKLNITNEKDIIQKIIDYVFIGIGFIAVFVISRLVLWIAEKILESIFELPILKTFNKLGGVITSAVLFLVEISILLAIIKSLSAIAFIGGVVNVIESSVITKTLYDHNIFTSLILSKII